MLDENDTGLDMSQIMKRYAYMNPHISLSDIAFLMDTSYDPEAEEYDQITEPETIESAASDACP